MIDHLSFGVTDFERSAIFYDRALAPLGVSRLFHVTSGPVEKAAYGNAYPNLWIAADPAAVGKLHLAFTASDKDAVDAFYREALASGGTDNGAPGFRPEYHSGYYGAYVIDPDGHNIEAVFHDKTALIGVS
ncbi:VOC family protein (plasmid) [Agrobacterium sp. rho-13.3]|uniref:VOC family protein n=1 Tax=Agrobacterium sp. rho-13.3 TaxID=3072980 RepID=UPI002A10A92E|nr:VOC family protein [Agrobacterium sp. rho-13.3]MDX8311876.1 VOC family protein [Agrobacterium sp. rho-13.3]